MYVCINVCHEQHGRAPYMIFRYLDIPGKVRVILHLRLLLKLVFETRKIEREHGLGVGVCRMMNQPETYDGAD